ncbi:phospholipase D family protein, partial [Kingella kingae]|nr:phospholipase D family protein [Kingella kingae]
MNPTYILSILTCCALTACQSLPDLSLRQASHYIPTQSAPQLEAALLLPDTKSSLQPKSPNKNNTHNAQIYVLDHARDAYVARTILLDNAQISLDAQYYI